MDCKNTELLINKYIDNELDDKTRQLVHRHAETCQSCREKLHFYKMVEDLGRKTPEVLPPADFTDKVMGIVNNEKNYSIIKEIFPQFLPWPRLTLVFSAAVIILMLFAVRFTKFAQQEITVRFKVDAPQANSVSLVGDFNNWDINACRLKKENGVWTANIPLKRQRYQYMFVIDGSVWIADPGAGKYADDGYGNKNSVIDLYTEQI